MRRQGIPWVLMSCFSVKAMLATGFNSSAPGRCGSNFIRVNSECISGIKFIGISCKIRTPCMMSHHRPRQWLVAARQQAITWANIEHNLCRPLVSLDRNALTLVQINMYTCRLVGLRCQFDYQCCGIQNHRNKNICVIGYFRSAFTRHIFYSRMTS